MQIGATKQHVEADSINAVYRAMALARIEDLAKGLLNEFDPVKRRAGLEAIVSAASSARREPDQATQERIAERIRVARTKEVQTDAPRETPVDGRNPDFVPRPAPRPGLMPAPDAPPRVKRAAPRC